MVCKMALIQRNGGLDVTFHVPNPEKVKNSAERRVFRQNPSTALGCSELQELKTYKKLTRFWYAKLCVRGNKMHGQIITKFCRDIWVHDLCRFILWSLTRFGRGKRVKFSLSPLTCFVTLTTLLHYHASVWSLNNDNLAKNQDISIKIHTE